MRQLRPHVAVLSVLCSALTAFPAAAPTPAHAGAVVPGGATVTIALPLAARDTAALHAAARLPRGSAAAGRRLRQAATPAPRSRADTSAYVRSYGLRVTHESPWLILATGTARQAAAAFPTPRLRSGQALTPSPEVRVPAALRGIVSAVGGLDTTRRWRHRAVPTGLTRTDLTAAYHVPPLGSGTGVTVATLQFSGWNKGDLDVYAAAANLPQKSPVVVETLGGSATTLDGLGGEFEVALDQQALLAAAPNADQRIYFGGNDGGPDGDAQTLAAYERLAKDAEAGLYDVLSISWGQCEDALNNGIQAALDAYLARIVAAGRTVFAASGDFGSYDCDGPLEMTEAVDFPAASEWVVGVGGTELTRSGSTWTETVWNEWDAAMLFSPGGGFSKFAARPSWQPGSNPTDPSSPADSPAMRMVPDISADAHTGTGLGIYVATAGGWTTAGGTSLSAPLVAGHFASALSTMGRTNGLGEALHPLLYANPSAFRDVVSGNNVGFEAGPGYDQVTGLGAPLWNRMLSVLQEAPIVAAPATSRSTTVQLTVTPPTGTTFTRWQICVNAVALTCDTPALTVLPANPAVTIPVGPGRVVRTVVVGWVAAEQPGGPDVAHPGVAYTRYDATAPVARAKAAFTAPTGTTATFSWSSTDAAVSSGLDRYQVKIMKYGVTTPYYAYEGPATALTRPLTRGGRYTLSVRAYDRAGNASATSRALVNVPYDQVDLVRGSGWVTTRSSSNFRGSALSSASAGRRVAKSVRARYVDLMVTTGPTGGYVDVYVGGTRVRRLDTYSSTRRYRQHLRATSWSTSGSRTVTFVVVGRHRSSSRGSYVVIDGLRAS